MAALLHPDTFSLFSLDPEPATTQPVADAPWNAPSFLGGNPAPARRVVALRPQLQLVPGGLVDAHSGSTAEPVVATRRLARTLAAGLALAMLVAFAALGLLTLLGADAAANVPASPAAINHPTGVDATTTPSTPVEVVVRSGDTLWSIARRIKPTGEIRGLVDALAERAGGASVDAGQHIDISGLLSQ